MTVDQLREVLAVCEGDALVVMARDSEGNGFGPLSEVARAGYRADSKWSGKTGMLPHQLTAAKMARGYTEEDVMTPGDDGAVLAVVLWPVN